MPSASRDRVILYLVAGCRATGTSLMAVVVGAYLVGLGLPERHQGLVIASGLAGCVAATLLVTRYGDRLGRRAMLAALALVAAVGGGAVALGSAPALLGAAAFIGMVNAMGRDRGAAPVLEQAMLPTTASDGERTAVFAWYHVVQDIGHALGAALAALPTLLVAWWAIPQLDALRLLIGLYCLLAALSASLYPLLSPRVELRAPPAPRLSPAGGRVVRRISALFLLDAVGGGFLTTTWLSAFFIARFEVPLAWVAALFVGARLLNAVSHLGAAWLAKRIGLVNTMVFTHIPSSLLLMTVPIAPDFATAAGLFLLREGLVEMDVPTRQSYLMAVLPESDRARAGGITSLVRMGGWTLGQAGAALLPPGMLGLSLTIGGGMKIAYDCLLYRAFRGVKPPEERDGAIRP